MTEAALAELGVPLAGGQNVARRLLRDPLGVVATMLILVSLVISVIGPWIAPYDPNFTDLSQVLGTPDANHLLGTDSAGRDVISRLIVGTRLTLAAAAIASVVSVAIGVPSGLLAGYYGGWFDSVSSWTSNSLLSLPGIIVLLAVRAAAGPSVWVSMAVFGVLLSPSFFRLVRTAVRSVRNELYVDAAKVSGLRDRQIIGRHILAVVRAPIIIQVSIVAGIAIAVQSGLEFLGLGDLGVPTWGMMISEGFQNLYIAPLLLLWPSAALVLMIASLAVFGNALRDALEDGQPQGATRRAAKTAPSETPSAVERTDSAHLFEVAGLGVGYRAPDGTMQSVVEGVSLHLDKGEVLGIVGESGSGKSQTAFAILGLLPETAHILSGSIVIDGTQTVAPGAEYVNQQAMAQLRGKRVAYIPQEPMSNLNPAFTVGQQLIRPMVKILGISRNEAHDRAVELLSTVGIDNPQRIMRSYAHELSGGMAQRVLIAGAVSCSPDLLIADEPTTALDVTVQAEVLDLLRDLRERFGMGMVIVTHNFGVVADICDRVLVMSAGHVVETGTVREIIRSPKAKYTQELLASTLEGKAPRSVLSAAPEVEA